MKSLILKISVPGALAAQDVAKEITARLRDMDFYISIIDPAPEPAAEDILQILHAHKRGDVSTSNAANRIAAAYIAHPLVNEATGGDQSGDSRWVALQDQLYYTLTTVQEKKTSFRELAKLLVDTIKTVTPLRWPEAKELREVVAPEDM